jgi:uncharacterized SAM-binding protein YcdF (DUF218 family)
MPKLSRLHSGFFSFTLYFTELTIAFCFWGWITGFLLLNSTLDKNIPFLPLKAVDAIVVFTGSEGRVQTGIALLKRGIAKHLFISGVQSKSFKIPSPEDKKLSITLGYAADNTFENVDETVEWLKKKDFLSVCLVTSDFHMPRSLFLLRLKMPNGIFYPYPLTTPNPKRFFYTLREYHKLLACLIFQNLGHQT